MYTYANVEEHTTRTHVSVQKNSYEPDTYAHTVHKCEQRALRSQCLDSLLKTAGG